MGCCFSTPRGPNAPYPGGAPPSSSARAINSPRLAAHPDDGSSRTGTRPEDMRSVARRRARHDPQQPLSEHIDKPLRRHVWASKNRTWTRAQLARERADFFDTRVTGRPEIWQTLHAALEILWEADAAAASRTAAPAPVAPADDNESREPDDDADDADEDTALATAQSILKAAEITLPTGNLSNGVYDALGTYYALPEWIVCDPVNVAEGSEEQVDDDRSRAAKEVGEDGEDPAAEEGVENVLNEDEDEALRRREEKGKAVADVRDLVKLRARLSENSRDIIVSVGSNETARSVARKITDEANLPSNKRIKLAYMGKILKETSSLQDQGWTQGHVINALVFPRL